MSDHTKIEWADATWNVVLGCDRVSPGCQSCYAIGNARIRESNPNPKIAKPYAGLVERLDDRLDWTGRVDLIPDRKIFVTAQSDVWHAAVSTDFLVQVFAVMAVARRHVFQVLTKRPGRMRSLLANPDFIDRVRRHAASLDPGLDGDAVSWPLPNVWLGVSAEDARSARVRIPILQTPRRPSDSFLPSLCWGRSPCAAATVPESRCSGTPTGSTRRARCTAPSAWTGSSLAVNPARRRDRCTPSGYATCATSAKPPASPSCLSNGANGHPRPAQQVITR